MNTEASKFIRTVTVTGADDSIKPEELIAIARDYPFVEFGILISRLVNGFARFPSRNWLERLYPIALTESLPLSAHLCGPMVKEFCLGNSSFLNGFGNHYLASMFQRFQLNFHAQTHEVDREKFIKLVRERFYPLSIIFQMDGVNEQIFFAMASEADLNFTPLFDISRGAGILPEFWPEQFPGVYSGYAGGLSSDNLSEQIPKIAQAATGEIWIDAETLLRSKGDLLFDLDKVRAFLEQAKPWVIDLV